ncbi:MAG TPA: 2-nitropropane dioxygenase [Propioniciclava tarda]|nr:2-nitropropane dioxygenase [Propioniciclava tarda]HQD60785.1 2-nitropropane dioxygenase [Propioniciclava tarda]
MTAELQVPIGLRTHLAHAVVDCVAREIGADVLHIKGPAVDDGLRPVELITHDDGSTTSRTVPRLSTDADVLVRPSQARALVAALIKHGWSVVTRFETGSIFEHAASLWHTQLGYLDVHRRFPGVDLDAEAAFDVLWSERLERHIAHQPCPVPSTDGQRLILLLHAARGGGVRHPDAQLLWEGASADEQKRCRDLAARLDADLALAAASGRLDDFVGHPAEHLWRLLSANREPSRAEIFAARWRATPGLRARLHLLARVALLNTDHLSMRLGHAASRRDVLTAYAQRVPLFGREAGKAGRRLLARIRGRR